MKLETNESIKWAKYTKYQRKLEKYYNKTIFMKKNQKWTFLFWKI